VAASGHPVRRRLLEVLVEEAPELAKDRRERWWRRIPLSLSWSLADVRGDAVGEAVAIAAEHENLEHHVGAVRG
jgi:hypothetical protein